MLSLLQELWPDKVDADVASNKFVPWYPTKGKVGKTLIAHLPPGTTAPPSSKKKKGDGRILKFTLLQCLEIVRDKRAAWFALTGLRAGSGGERCTTPLPPPFSALTGTPPSAAHSLALAE